MPWHNSSNPGDLQMFDIIDYTADSEGLIYVCRWNYTNSDGTVGGTHALAAPEEGYSIVPLGDIDKETLLEWLAAQLPNTADDFDAHIANNKAATEKVETSTTFVF